MLFNDEDKALIKNLRTPVGMWFTE